LKGTPLTESQRINFKQPVRSKKYDSLQKFDVKHNTTTEKQNATSKKYERQLSGKKDPQLTLTLYDTGGKIRSEQPAALGSHIDIII
jgi:hypothetical protein